ncbi:MAG: hypothetical protein QOK03_2800 [Candidatus Binataceae bacterium]|nr:hypothetical protein [Candidatus Binataceae bacterium]
METTEYEVRRLTAQDAAAIPELTTRVNGPDYIHPEVYHPERLLSMNQSGQLLSVVAVHAGTDVVGHAALERPDPEPYAESGEAMVLLEHRHHHLLDRMKEMLDAQGREIGLTGIFGNAVTHHIFSQLTEERAKAQPTAILLGSSPAAAHQLKDFPQRVSLITYFKYTSVPGAARLHLPPRHRPLAERIFRATGRQVEFLDSQSAATSSASSQIESSYDSCLKQGNIKVIAPGHDAHLRISEAEHAFRTQGAEVVFAELPLQEPATSPLCEEMERRGFFFCGYAPRDPQTKDRLLLQKLMVPLDVAHVQLSSEFAHELLAYITAERLRVSLNE